MYNRILVPLDGSELAEQILPHVEALASRFGATVTILWATDSAASVIAETAGAGMDGGAMLDPTPIVDAEQDAAVDYLQGVAGRLRGHGLTVSEEHPEGPAAEMIVQRAAELGADLIAMTTHGRGGLGRLVFGSVADRVLRHSTCPLLLVRVREEEARPAASVPIV